jgi:uncharacterized integral membrane protein (TIGR00698 family)
MHVPLTLSKEKALFFVGIVLTATGLVSPGFALALGLVYGLTFLHPYATGARAVSKVLLQGSVVALGFGMNVREVAHAGRSGLVYTALGIVGAMGLGLSLGRLLGVGRTASLLTSAGTAICGGSAIAALGPIANASEEEMAVSLGTVFLLNSIALFIFPSIGAGFRLSQTQFGLWSALAIHDTSSVVGATAKYGAVALAVGTTVKLVRALWILPLCLATAVIRKSKARMQWPWFILFFGIAAVTRSGLPQFEPVYQLLVHLGRVGLAVTLYLIGSGVSRETLRSVGFRPLAQGFVLWVIVAVSSLALVRLGWISI